MGITMQEFLKINLTAELPFAYSAGEAMTKFLIGMKRGIILASKCKACKHVLVPPRKVCGKCYEEMTQIVEVGPEGKITAFSVANFEFIDPMTGTPRPVPYGYAIIRLKGCKNGLIHFLDRNDPAQIRVGQKVKAVFAPRKARTGSIMDIKYFQILG